MKKFIPIIVLLFISIASTSCSSYSAAANDVFSEEKNMESYTSGGYSYVKAQGHWIDDREAAKRSAVIAAQRNYASNQSSTIAGHYRNLEDPTTVRVLSTEVLEEETKHEDSWLNNQEWRFTVRVKIENHSSNSYSNKKQNISQKQNYSNVSKDGKYYSVSKSDIGEQTKVNQSFESDENWFGTNDDEEWMNQMTSKDKRRYAIYAGLAAGGIFVATNPWLLLFL
jgi:hypothetical protein